jgi:hypothetical protein
MTESDKLTDRELAELERLADEGAGENIGEIAEAWLDMATRDGTGASGA